MVRDTLCKNEGSLRITGTFTHNELDIIAERYIHCSANWHAIVVDNDGPIRAALHPLQLSVLLTAPMKSGNGQSVTWTERKYETEDAADPVNGGLKRLSGQ